MKILSADKNHVIDSINGCGQFANCGALQKILQGELQQKIKAQGIRPDIVALDAFDSYIDGDLARLAPLVKGIAEKP